MCCGEELNCEVSEYMFGIPVSVDCSFAKSHQWLPGLFCEAAISMVNKSTFSERHRSPMVCKDVIVSLMQKSRLDRNGIRHKTTSFIVFSVRLRLPKIISLSKVLFTFLRIVGSA